MDAVCPRRLTSADADVRASDGLVTFSVMWAMALIFSVVSHCGNLKLDNGYKIALLEYAVLGKLRRPDSATSTAQPPDAANKLYTFISIYIDEMEFDVLRR